MIAAIITCGLVTLAVIAGATMLQIQSETVKADLLRRNEELTDHLLRYQGKEAIYRPTENRTKKASPGYFDGVFAPSQKGTT